MFTLRRSAISRVLHANKFAAARNFSRSCAVRELQLFDMPSMSPTMEEGGIVEWKVQQGESFKAGDVLLEIETDKAEIAVEAGDDGILAKILVEAGSKGIAVGKPIAVTAEEGDDLSNVDYDALISSKAAKPADAAKSNSTDAAEPAKPSPPADSEPQTNSQPSSNSSSESTTTPSSPPSHGNHGTEPLPAAMRLIHEHNLSVDDIKGSGPYGRITKGDILAYLGKIPKAYPLKEQERFHKMEKMDLSNIQLAPKSKASEAESEPAPAAQKPAQPQSLVTQVSIPLDATVVSRVAAAQRVAMRAALLSLKPKPSVLRDPTLDLLTTSSKPPFVVKSAKVQVLRAKPVSLDVVVEEPFAAQPSKATDVFLTTLQAELALAV